MMFQASDFKKNHFLDLLNNNFLSIKLIYTKNDVWLKLIGHSNFLCVRVIRAITNHTPIGKYYLRFFPKENFSCLCRVYPIESK